MFRSKHFKVSILEPLIKLLRLEPGCVGEKLVFFINIDSYKTISFLSLLPVKDEVDSISMLNSFKTLNFLLKLIEQPRWTLSVFTRILIFVKIHGHPCFISTKRDAFNQS